MYTSSKLIMAFFLLLPIAVGAMEHVSASAATLPGTVVIDMSGGTAGALSTISDFDKATLLLARTIKANDPGITLDITTLQNNFKQALQALDQTTRDGRVKQINQIITSAAASLSGKDEIDLAKVLSLGTSLLMEFNNKVTSDGSALSAALAIKQSELDAQASKTKKYSIISGVVGTLLSAGLTALSTYFGSGSGTPACECNCPPCSQ